ncbi:hypothetical protein BXO91_15775 [Rhodococcus qingshengii]|nr:hypothetical protein BXO91_15775 [Rhodococcus qingshengii]
MVALGDMAEFINGVAFKPDDWSATGRRIVRIQNLNDPAKSYNRTEREVAGKYHVGRGDLLVSWSASLGVYEWREPDIAVVNQHIFRVVPFPEVVDKGYLRHGLVMALGSMEGHLHGATMKHVNRGQFLATEILLPPLSEQRRIAAILDHVDALRAKRREALRDLRLLPQDVYLERFGDPIANTRRLPVVPLGDLIDPERPLTYGILMPGPDQGVSGVKYVRVVDMKDGEILVSGVRSTTSEIAAAYRRSRLRSGDLLMSIRGHVGRFATVPDVLDGANITQDTARFALVGANGDYVRECLSTYGFQRWMDRHTKGVAVRGINLGDLRKMPIPVPSTAEQEEFSSQVRQINILKRKQQSALGAFDDLFASLQSRAFRGEL